MRFLSSSVMCFAMSAFLSLRLPSSPDRARGRQEVVGAHDTEQPGFAKVNALSFPREGYGVCHHSPSLCLTLLCLLLIAEVTTPNRVRLLPQSTGKIFCRKRRVGGLTNHRRMCYKTAHLLWETNDVERYIANDTNEEAWNGIGNDAAYNHAQTRCGASAHGANTPPV